MLQHNSRAEELIKDFNSERTETKLQECQNFGLRKILLPSGEPMQHWEDGFKNFREAIPVYERINNEMKITKIGFY